MRNLTRSGAVLAGAVAVVLSSVMGIAAAPGASAAGRAPASGRAADPPFAYVANTAGNRVSVVDTADNTVTANIAVGTRPIGVAISPDGRRVYVANFGAASGSAGSVSVIDTARVAQCPSPPTLCTTAVIATITTGANSTAVAFSPDGSRAYVTNYGANSVSVINTTTNPPTVIATLSATPAIFNGPYAVAVSPDGSFVYVTNTNGTTLSRINTATPACISTPTAACVTAPAVQGLSAPYGIAFPPGDSSRAYVTNRTNPGRVSVINTANPPATAVIANITVGVGPQALAVSPDGSRIYVANQVASTVSVINTTTNPPTVIATLGTGTPARFAGPEGIAFTPDGNRVYVTNTNGGSGTSLSMINLETPACMSMPTNACVTAPAVSGLAGPAGIAIAPELPKVPQVFAGYADGYRMIASDHPDPWQGSANVIFVGCNLHTPITCSTGPNGPIYDAGALRMVNNTGHTITVSDAYVTGSSVCQWHPWTGVVRQVPNGDSLILTQTGGPAPCPGTGGKQAQNFDTSELNIMAGTAVCTVNNGKIPVFHVDVNGEPLAYVDTHQILNTHGVDPGNPICGSHNETHDWAATAMTLVTP